MSASITVSLGLTEAKVLRDVLAINRGDIREALYDLRGDLDEFLGDHAKTVAKRWRVKPVLRNNGTVKYLDVQARNGNPLI